MLVDYRKVNIYQDERRVLKDVDFQVNNGELYISSAKWDRVRVRC